MGLHNGLIAILIVTLLFLEVGRWHVNGETLEKNVTLYGPPINTSDKTPLCTKLVSRRESQFVPYRETFKTRNPYNPFMTNYQTNSRFNYKLEHHIIHREEATCCEGYVQIGVTCQPRCPQSCKKGICVVPDVCTCNEGYRSTSNDTNGSDNEELCVPMCANDCVNGTCIEPYICSCNESYWMDSDGHTCRPVCDEECERNNGHCTEPNVCSCRPGYRSAGNDSIHHICDPVCDRTCTNGYCTAPNVCKCAYGYEADELDPRFTCKPKCDETCEFGACTAPGICTCDKGYRAVNASVCEPICSEPCEMGICIAPETCSCNDGYEHRNGSSKYVCEPVCEKSCGNGTCTAPGVCACDRGFIYNQRDETCKPYCAIPCGNGTCVSYNECKCFEGYEKAPDYRFSHYHMVFRHLHLGETGEVQPYSCLPICDFGCKGGVCVASNMCMCLEGFYLLVRKDNVRVCVPKNIDPSCYIPMNSPCRENGKCYMGTCTCNEGYTMDVDTYSCVPFVCAQTCSNGICTGPNRCTCNDGFVPRNNSFCEPVCEKGCQNGDCIGPNHCVCHDDFIPNTGHHFEEECIPACTRNCSGHGVCVVDDEYRCECHLGWTGRDCDQPTMCVLTMDFDQSDINRITIHNDANDTIMQVHENAPHCHQCDSSLNNESLCYMMQSDEGNIIPTVRCLLSTDLPCYTMPRYNASINVTKIVWSFVIIAMLFATSLIMATYLMYRRYQRKKLIAAHATNTYAQESFASESLLSENVIYL